MKKNQWMIALSTLLGYGAAYIARNVLSAIMPSMTDGGVDGAILSLAGSLFFFSYGIGQFINGLVGDYIKAKIIVPLGLLISALTLFGFPAAIGLDTSGAIACVLWCICGFALSMLWGPITKVVAENIPGDNGVKVMTWLNVASVLGMLVTYVVCALAAALGNWPIGFYICGALTVCGSVVAYVLLDIPERRGELIMLGASDKGSDVKERMPLSQLLPFIVSRALLPMLVVGAANGVLRNSVSFWTPTYINANLGASPELSSLISALIPIVNIGATFVGLYILAKFKNDESLSIMSLFALSAVCFVLLGVTGSLPVLNLVLLFVASAAMCSVCNLYFSKYCLRFTETGRVSLISGGLDCFCYIAAAVASEAFSGISESFGWNAVSYVWGGIALLGVVFSLMSSFIIRKSEKASDK